MTRMLKKMTEKVRTTIVSAMDDDSACSKCSTRPCQCSVIESQEGRYLNLEEPDPFTCNIFKGPLRQNSAFIRYWNILMLLLILVTLGLVPLELFFKIPPNVQPMLRGVDMFLTVPFAFNIVVCFRTCILVKTSYGMVEISKQKDITAKYLEKWFWLDLLATLPFGTIFSQISPTAGRVASILRTVRLLRFFSISKEQTHVGIGYTLSRLFHFIVFTISLAWYIGALWWFLSQEYADDSSTILSRSVDSGQPLTSQVLTSLHWGLWAMVSVGSELKPSSDLESGLALLVIVIGLFVFATVLGQISNIFAQMDTMSTRFQDQVYSMMDFLNAKNIPVPVQRHVLTYVKQAWAMHGGYEEQELLKSLPTEMRAYIYRFLYKVSLEGCTLFQDCSTEFVQALCPLVVPDICLAGDLIVRQGAVERTLYLITVGHAEVVDLNTQVVKVQLKAGAIFGEVNLFSCGARTASVRAVTFCEVLILEAEGVLEVLRCFPREEELFRSLAKQRETRFSARNKLLEKLENNADTRISRIVEKVGMTSEELQELGVKDAEGFAERFGSNLGAAAQFLMDKNNLWETDAWEVENTRNASEAGESKKSHTVPARASVRLKPIKKGVSTRKLQMAARYVGGGRSKKIKPLDASSPAALPASSPKLQHTVVSENMVVSVKVPGKTGSAQAEALPQPVPSEAKQADTARFDQLQTQLDSLSKRVDALGEGLHRKLDLLLSLHTPAKPALEVTT